jgi:hypothetical protein
MSSPIGYVENEHNMVSAVVDHVMFKKTLPEQFWQWMLEMGLWHLRELKLDVWQEPKTELLPVTDRKTVVLPSGFVDWTKIGVAVGQYVVTLGVNDKLKLTQRTTDDNIVAGLLSQNLPNGLDFNAYGGYYFFNYNGGSLKGIGGGFVTKGSFRLVDHGTCKELLLDYDYSYDHVYLEYITDGFSPCGQTILNPYLCNYFLKGMEFSWEEEKNPNKTEASIFRKGQDLAAAARVVRARKNNLDPHTLINISRANTRFTSKI